MTEHTFTIRGVRGGMTAAGPEFQRHGADTTCFTLESESEVVIVDAGTGIIPAGRALQRAPAGARVTILFTHFHLDHVMGLPFFPPFYRKGAAIRLMGDPRRGEDWRQSVRTIFGPPYWPVSIARAGAEVSFEDIPWDAGFLEVAGARICWCPVWHPQQCLAYRIATPRRSIVIATDREPGNPAGDSAFLDFCRGAQVLIYDAQYTPEEYSAHRGWGHGTWRDGVEVARASGIEELILTHHDRQRTDNELDRILAAAREAFPRVRMAACDFEIRA